MAGKSTIVVMSGKITLNDASTKSWENYINVFDTLAKLTKSKTALLLFEAPDITRGLLDAVPKGDLERKFKIRIEEGRTEAPLNITQAILKLAKGFDIVVRVDAIDLIFFHTGKLEVLAELQAVVKISELLHKMFPKAAVKS